MKRSDEQMIERHLSALKRRRDYLVKRQDEKGAINSFIEAEINALNWVLGLLEKK